MTTTKKSNFCRKILISLLLAFLGSLLFSEEKETWVLAAEKFTFSQKNPDSAIQATATSLPSLVLEQIAENLVRFPRALERQDAELYALKTARLSLFLQLSKEVKERDAVFLNNYSASKLKYKLKAQDKKIAELQKKVEENLEKTREVRKKYVLQIDEDEKKQKRFERGEIVEEEKIQKNFFRDFIFDKESEEKNLKDVTFYKNDVTSLFEAGKNLSSIDYSSYNFEKACVDAKISGLLTGKISVYGSYISVAVDIYSFPGANIIASAMEVGDKDDLKSIAVSLARALTPKIADSMPVELEFEIEPAEAKKNLQITVDDVVYKNVEGLFRMQSGVHRIMFSSPGYNSIATSFAFNGNRKFHVRADMVKSDNGSANLYFRKHYTGDVFANGKLAGSLTDDIISSKIVIDGHSILGHFIDENGETADFYVPEKLMTEDNNILVRVKTFNRSDYIEKRRKLMYISYSALIVSLMPTFYCYGNSYAASRGYNYDYGVSREEAINWQNASNICTGISIGIGAWWVYELIRYLQSANTVLPAKARVISEKEVEKVKDKEAVWTEKVKIKKSKKKAKEEAKTDLKDSQKSPEDESDSNKMTPDENEEDINNKNKDIEKDNEVEK